ncbi:MAG: T9SS type A sorting domain-containing protein, partial [Calditrichaeota bacterium]|nr:T9SS type A sorting domain-containing protein [Calditrichota bacterium]
WISWEPEEGEIAPDDEAQVMVTVNLDGLVAGIYAASLHFLSNDPNNPDIALDIMINTVYRHIEVTPEELDFGIVDDPEPRSEILTVSNIGNVLLTITSVRIHPDSPLVTDFENEIHIEPRESSEITVTYTPDVPGELHTQILISSNADEALLRVPVYALYISPPTIGVDPLIIESFDGGEYPMTLTNEGGSPLEWSTTIDAEWLSIEPSAGQNDFWVETNLVLSIDTTGLASGNYDTDLIFNSNDPVTPELAIGISLEVTELGVSGDFQTPEGFGLNTIYPNPFNSTSTISFSLDTQGEVSLQMFDMTGQLLRDLIPGTNMGQGEYKIIVEAADLPAGSYSIRLQQNDNIQTQTISLIK